MTSQNCPVCNSPMKFINAGVSKTTGKPYNAFWACPNRCPKPSFSGQYEYGVPSIPSTKILFETVMERKEQSIEKAQERKADAIAIAGAKRDAGLIVAAMIHIGELKSSDWFIQYKAIAEKIYNYNFEEKEIKPEPNFPPEVYNSDEIIINSIPF